KRAFQYRAGVSLHASRPGECAASEYGHVVERIATLPQNRGGGADCVERDAAGGAGLFVRTLENLRQQLVGFEVSHLINFPVDPASSGYGEDRTPQIITSAIERLAAIPGVQRVAGTTDPELTGDSNTSNYSIQGYKPGEDEKMDFEQPEITPGY